MSFALTTSGLFTLLFATLTAAGIGQAAAGLAVVLAFRSRLVRADRDAPGLDAPSLDVPASDVSGCDASGCDASGCEASGRIPPPSPSRPPMTILKPLCGDEPLLEAALASLCAITYPRFQIVFGVQDEADPAIAVVARLRARFPARDIALVIDPTPHGANRKIANLINMLPAAKHDVLVIGDSDVHVRPDYLERIAEAFAAPGTGLVTTLYAGLAADRSVVAALGASGISHGFLPGALMARVLGRQDTLGATMALRRETLTAIGGLASLVDHLADDHVLGDLVQGRGLAVRLAATVTATTVPERHLADLFRHELRWARTVLSLVPAEFALSAIQFPLAWALGALALSGAAGWTIALAAFAWVVRAGAAIGIDRALGLSSLGPGSPPPVLLLPVLRLPVLLLPVVLLPARDLLSVAVMLASYASDRVEWRGRMLHTGRGQSGSGQSDRDHTDRRQPRGDPHLAGTAATRFPPTADPAQAARAVHAAPTR